MATPNPLFRRATTYAEQHRSAKENLPAGGLQPETFVVAVRHHVEDFNTAESFLCFTVKPTTTVARVKKAYFSKYDVQVSFKHANAPISDATQMQDLNHFGDYIVVFTAHQETLSSAPSSSSQTQTSLPNNGSQARDISPVVKSEPTADNQLVSLDQDSGTSHMTAPSLAHSNNENNATSELSNASISSKSFPADLEFRRYAGGNGAFGDPSSPAPAVNSEIQADDQPMYEADSGVETVTLNPQVSYLQKIIDQGSPERLESTVKAYQAFLDSLKTPLSEKASQSQNASHFLQQVEVLRTEKVDTPTIIGVVGNTGAGKSSVINAMLEEERLVPTNCMRACTAVVTELSWNSSEDPRSKYRASIEFIQTLDWEKDLRVSLADLLDHNGQFSKECTNAESEAGIAYAKIKAVYPNKTKEKLANCTVQDLMNEPWVKAVLGTIKNIQQASPEPFYRSLQRFVDSSEKTTESKQRQQGAKSQPEYWPLIKVVKIYTKADALSTGAVIVDLPGVQDSNAARAAVAADYMKQCTGLWIVAPINRAVDDKAAKNLMGESFKRQLKYDGTYSRITFICSKSDDISVTEASDSLGLEEEMREDWERIDEIDAKKTALKKFLQEIRVSMAVHREIMEDAEDAIDLWEKLREGLEDGDKVFAPLDKSKKRKRSAKPKEHRKKCKKPKSDDNYLNDDRDEQNESNDFDAGFEKEYSQSYDNYGEDEEAEPLTMVQIEEKLSQLKENKKRAKKERAELDGKIGATDEEIMVLEAAQDNIETAMSAMCIAGRNKYSKGAIQQDFAAGIRELDQENSAEDDENFNPEEDIRDYEEVARSLPVFCCSSRAYQKISGRLQRDSNVPGFRSKEETEIPQLQQHCKQLTEGVRTSNCRRFLTNLSQTLNSLHIWASNDGSGIKTSDSERQAEAQFLKARLRSLDYSLDHAVKSCLSEMIECLTENIFENFPDVIKAAASKAVPKAQSWGAPVNRSGVGQPGGFHWVTYRALMRRNGVFRNANGPHDLNMDLCKPIITSLASHWEKAFSRRLPTVLTNFSRKSKILLMTFHKEFEVRSVNQGAGVAGMAMLSQQLRNYEGIFVNLSSQMLEIITAVQREASRDFTPIIGRKLADAYESGADEQGAGSFSRMKAGMNDHVANNLNMFKESCDEVKNKLTLMCSQVGDAMSNKTDEVYMNMSRDYMEVVSGKKVDEMVPKWERQLRAEVSRLIEEREQADLEADEAGDKAKLDATNADASAGPSHEAVADEADYTSQDDLAQPTDAGSDSDEMTPGSETSETNSYYEEGFVGYL